MENKEFGVFQLKHVYIFEKIRSLTKKLIK